MPLIFKVALGEHEAGEETAVFDQACVVREEAVGGHGEVASEDGKDAWEDGAAFASCVGVQEEGAIR